MHFLRQDCDNLKIRVSHFHGNSEIAPVYLLNMSVMSSSSVSAASIFCADESCGRPPPNRKDMLNEFVIGLLGDQDDRCDV